MALVVQLPSDRNNAMYTSKNSLNSSHNELLKHYVTNLDGDVFALQNLPEVLKGALFSRYSRSKLGLRELLIKDFLPAGILSIKDSTHSILNIKSAEEFYSRVLDNYGDDSVGELGGAHLALEQVSMLAAKAIQDARIGGSPLEKSTRYLSFSDKQDGEYRFYRDPRLLASPHCQLYLRTCHNLFEGYQNLQIKLIKFFEEQQDPEKTITTEERIITRSKAFDTVRGILPTATLTNMGIFGNGRFFETLLQRLSISPLSECRQLSKEALKELKQVIPSFVKRADPTHKYCQTQQAYWQDLNKQLQQLAASQLPSQKESPAKYCKTPTDTKQSIKLLQYDKDAPTRVAATLAYQQSDLPLTTLRQWVKSTVAPNLTTIFESLAEVRKNRRQKPPRATELAFYTFECTADYGVFRDLHRHRMMTQERQLLTPKLGWTMPDEIITAGEAETFTQLMQQAVSAHKVISQDFPVEAQYIVPMACHVRWYMHINLRALIWLTELRSTEQGHPAYRTIAQEMARLVQEVHPAFKPLFRYVNISAKHGRIVASKKILSQRQTSLLSERQISL